MAEPGPEGNLIKLNTARRRQGTLARIHAYGAILDAIVRSEFEPGRQLSENELAAWLGVSRTPVREALARLREDGLVEIVYPARYPMQVAFSPLLAGVKVGDNERLGDLLLHPRLPRHRAGAWSTWSCPTSATSRKSR